MKGNILEAVIGAIVLVVACFFMYFAYKTSGEKIQDGYELIARFDDIGGITIGSDVKLNGIKIGVVKDLKIDENYQAKLSMLVKNDVKIPNDSSASVTTDGIMGNKFIAIVTGFSSDPYKPGDEIENTRSSMNLENLIDKFALGGKSESSKN